MRGIVLSLILLAFAVTFAFAGCTALVIDSTNKYGTGPSYAVKNGVPEFFNAERKMPDVKFSKNHRSRKFKAADFSFAAGAYSQYQRHKSIKGKIYFPNNQNNGDIFIILPVSGGNLFSDLIAKRIAEAGFRAVRIDSGFKLLPHEAIEAISNEENAEKAIEFLGGVLKRDFKEHIIDLMRLIDFLEKSLSDHPKNFHAVGLSQGGIIANLLAAVDPRVRSLMMIVSSAKIAKIVLDAGMSEIGAARALQRLLHKKLELSYEKALFLFESQIWEVEPTTYASRLDKDKILMVSGGLDMLGLIDTAIPLSATKETWECYGKPEWVILLFNGHITSFFGFLPFWVEIPYASHTAIMFFSGESYLAHLINHHFLPKALK